MEKLTNEAKHTCILQKYIENPLLVHKRKFDIRCYAMLTSINGNLKGFMYEQGYIRTSSVLYSKADFKDKFVHLTNDCIQKKSKDYGKYESGNKMDYSEFESYL